MLTRGLWVTRCMSICTVILVSGCGENLYVAHDTVVGVNAAVSADRAQGQFVFGFDRDFTAVVPVKEKGSSDATGGVSENREAMAVFGCSRVETQNIFLTRYSDVIATGSAAVDLAETLGKNGSTNQTQRLVTCGEDSNDG